MNVLEYVVNKFIESVIYEWWLLLSIKTDCPESYISRERL